MSKSSKLKQKKSTIITWNSLENLEETLAKKEVKSEKIINTPIQTQSIPESWEDSLNEELVEQKSLSVNVNLEKSREFVDETHVVEPCCDLSEIKVPEGLSWEEKQAYLIRMDEEEAKKSPYYRDDFEAMGLDEKIVHGIYSYGFSQPSRVQSRAITALMTGKDCVVQAQSGTGKTATFVIGALANVDLSFKNTQVIILSPTRELADQSFKVLKEISQYSGVTSVLCCGQMRIDDSIKNAQIIVGTTGRIIDCIGRQQINISSIKMIILDEADEMLSEGFKEQVSEIHEKVLNNRTKDKPQICLFSATLSSEILEYTNSITENPIKILIRQEFVTLKGISQFFINCVKEEYKLETLIDIYKRYMCTQSIIYVNSKNKCCWLASELIRKNHTVLYMDSSMPQKERQRIMKEFKSGTCRILVTTNLLSRGIDVQGVNLVINYDLPNINNIESYVHRIGRCGRYGRKGAAINFITPNDYYIIQNIRKYYSTEINELPEDISDLMTF